MRGMLRFLKNIFSKQKQDQTKDLMRITLRIGPLIDSSAQYVFSKYNKDLLHQPVTYIIPAIWGTNPDFEISPTQKAIYNEIDPLIQKIFAEIGLKNITKEQEFAIRYIIRNLLISKIIFMMELLKNQLQIKSDKTPPSPDDLKHMDTIGNA